eukprot:CAMPEP_0174929194 /NCGR_PEP_ID=MMETSP1355-20121228/27071_1 /TAXON_ID=464990 /ORGANISM="Hemiselmis tepida, Strain CCMP443" /LENGTH=412 /DNA_ID=CAMNT_0016175385 /DNA_START=303 /DNA_END=1537 /DNA_ORIENTATION=-
MPSTTPVGYIVLYDDITWFGISLAIVSNAFISTSLNVQKWAHNKNEALGEHRKPYTKLPVWWFGTAMNAIGELGNLVAYGYAESTVVAPIGAVGVLCSALIATFALREPFRKTDIVGILCIIAGVVLIVWAKGTEAVIEPTVEEAIQDYFIKPQSIIYTVLSLGATAAIYKYRHVYGEKYAIVYTMLCSLIAQWTVLGCKTFMAFVRLSVEKGNNQFCCGVTAVVPWVMFLVIVVCAVWSLHYLQMAMRYHNNNKVIPTYYATFTLCCIVGAAVVYREFEGASAASILTFFLGCFVAGVGVFTVSKDREKEAPTFPGATDLRMIEDMFDDDSTRPGGKHGRGSRRFVELEELNVRNSSVCASEGGADDSPRQSEHDSIAPALGDSEIHAESPASRVQGGLLDVQEGVKDLQG